MPRTYLVWGAAAAAVTSIALAALPLARHLTGGERALPSVSTGAPAPPEGSLADPILSWAPFGRPDPPAVPEATPEAPPEFTLNGVVIATGAAPSRASLSASGMPQQSFAVGEEVLPGITLAEVHPDHVVLTVDGQAEILGFPNASTPPADDSTVRPEQGEPVGN
ncbi:MAG: type II secretion system protein N [Amaricoccus sp.]